MRDWTYESRIDGVSIGALNRPMRGTPVLPEDEPNANPDEEYGRAFFSLEDDWERAWSADSSEGRGI